ncbi:MAG: hypothetical protein DME68_04780 [Verrucomicrobia bacterium]|nr:MAG: hypothetical protein DME68_04780 [Verrucomicrobiota bacterium]
MPAVATRTSESVIRSANARVEFFWFFFIFLSGWTPVFAVRGAGRLRIGRRFCLERRTRPGEIFGNFLKDVQMNFLRFRPRFYVEVGKRVKNFSNFRRFPACQRSAIRGEFLPACIYRIPVSHCHSTFVIRLATTSTSNGPQPRIRGSFTEMV